MEARRAKAGALGETATCGQVPEEAADAAAAAVCVCVFVSLCECVKFTGTHHVTHLSSILALVVHVRSVFATTTSDI